MGVPVSLLPMWRHSTWMSQCHYYPCEDTVHGCESVVITHVETVHGYPTVIITHVETQYIGVPVSLLPI